MASVLGRHANSRVIHIELTFKNNYKLCGSWGRGPLGPRTLQAELVCSVCRLPPSLWALALTEALRTCTEDLRGSELVPGDPCYTCQCQVSPPGLGAEAQSHSLSSS